MSVRLIPFTKPFRSLSDSVFFFGNLTLILIIFLLPSTPLVLLYTTKTWVEVFMDLPKRCVISVTLIFKNFLYNVHTNKFFLLRLEVCHLYVSVFSRSQMSIPNRLRLYTHTKFNFFTHSIRTKIFSKTNWFLDIPGLCSLPK